MKYFGVILVVVGLSILFGLLLYALYMVSPILALVMGACICAMTGSFIIDNYDD